MSGFSDALDWRPLFFRESFVTHSACALCGLLSKKAVRLACAHTLCLECHEESERLGGACPLDDKSFDDDDIVRLDISGDYMEKRTVSCWNAASGCDFEGPTSRLLEHYKQCTFHTVSCPRCQLSVLRREIVRHYKEGCSVSLTAPAADTICGNLHYDDIKQTSADLKRGMLKISEELSCLQTSFNQCREDLRTTERRTNEQLAAQSSTLSEQITRVFVGTRELLSTKLLKISEELSGLQACLSVCSVDVRKAGRRTKEQLEAQSSALSDQFTRLFTQCSTQMTGVKSAIVTTMQAHLAEELRAQNEKLMSATQSACDGAISFYRPETYYWYFKGWEALKRNASKKGKEDAKSSPLYACGYRLFPSIILIKIDGQLCLGIDLGIIPGTNDSRLEWPFRKTYTLGIVNTRDKARNIIHKVEASKFPACSSFQKPDAAGNFCFGTGDLYAADKMESDGFVSNDTLIFFFQVEP